MTIPEAKFDSYFTAGSISKILQLIRAGNFRDAILEHSLKVTKMIWSVQTLKHAVSPWWALATILYDQLFAEPEPVDADTMVKAEPKTWASLEGNPKP